MKTNVTMISEKDRTIYDVIIHQDTKDCMLSLTDLQEAYTHARIQNGWSRRDIQHDILNSKQNTERIYYILKEQHLINTDFSVFMENIEKDGITKTLKAAGAYRTTGRGENKRTMCNPYIWVLVAMELNPQIYAKVVVWLTDKLILNRIEAGNFYKTLSAALYKVPNPDYSAVSIALNVAIFGKHETGIRNKGSKEELEALYRLEDNIAFAINRGFVKTMPEIIDLIKVSANPTVSIPQKKEAAVDKYPLFNFKEEIRC